MAACKNSLKNWTECGFKMVIELGYSKTASKVNWALFYRLKRSWFVIISISEDFNFLFISVPLATL